MTKYIVAMALLGHGAGHAIGFLAAWTDLPMGFRDNPWVFGGDVRIQTSLGRAFGILWLVALTSFVVAAVGMLLREQWWGAVALAGSLVSILAILPWWSAVAPGPKFWALLVDALILLGLYGPWKDQVQSILE